MRRRQEYSLWMEEVEHLEGEEGAAAEWAMEAAEGGGQGPGARGVEKIYQVFFLVFDLVALIVCATTLNYHSHLTQACSKRQK